MAAEFSEEKTFQLSCFDFVSCARVQISPPLTAADETVGRSVPSIGLPSEVGNAFTGVSSLSLAVAEWIIDPRQVGRGWIDSLPRHGVGV